MDCGCIVTTQRRFNYGRYLASREWALMKAIVHKRSGGVCERCHFRKATQVNHLTYERIGEEWLEDLQHLCAPCHLYESGKSPFDPSLCQCAPQLAAEWAELLKDEPPEVYEAARRHAREVADAYA